MKKTVAVLLSLSPVAAFAAVPAGVTSAIETAGTDGVTIAGAVLVAIIAMFAFKLMRKGL